MDFSTLPIKVLQSFCFASMSCCLLRAKASIDFCFGVGLRISNFSVALAALRGLLLQQHLAPKRRPTSEIEIIVNIELEYVVLVYR